MRHNRAAPLPLLLAAILFGGCRGAFIEPRQDGGSDAGGDGGSEGRQCLHWSAQRNVYFGDLHVHTSWSWDAYGYGTRGGPNEAYDYARGAPLRMPNGIQVSVRRPLDFMAVTDHSEWLGEVWLCTDPANAQYDSSVCQNYRANTGDVVYFNDGGYLARHPVLCDGGVCNSASRSVWQRTQDAANQAYDRSAQCAFTAFNGYEYTGSLPNRQSNQHRNVIFRGDVVPPEPTTTIEAPTPEMLWQQLRAQCLSGNSGCDAIAIPHSMNYGRGLRFQWPSGGTQAEANDLARIEPLAEIYQIQGNSECKPGLDTNDPACAFEQWDPPICPNPDGGACMTLCGGDGGFCNARNDFLRNVLKDGLAIDAQLGANPFRLGFVASTDNHSAAPGSTDEDQYLANLTDGTPGARVSKYPMASMGGLAAVWAEENTRDSLFSAMLRRETYATSGTRLTVRFFAGSTLPTDLCQRGDAIELAYREGVPMGGVLNPAVGGMGLPPKFFISALADPGPPGQPGAPLQKIQVIKGWVAGGQKYEQVFDVAGDPNNGATVDPNTCVRSGFGASSLCVVWTDPSFNPSQQAFYYARVFENPSCRWSGHECRVLRDGGTAPTACDDGSVPMVVQERAWTSPIWYRP